MAEKQTEAGAIEACNRRPLIECLAYLSMTQEAFRIPRKPLRRVLAMVADSVEVVGNFHHPTNRTPKKVKKSDGVFEHDRI